MSGGSNGKRNNFLVSFSPASLLAFFTGAVGLGAGGVGPFINTEAAQRCFDNSETAIRVAAQHGEEMLALNQAITENRRLILERTAYRWTSEDEAKTRAAQFERDELQDKKIEYLEAIFEKR